MTDWADEKARQIIPCPENPDSKTAENICPFSWNSCRRANKCEAIDECAAALREARAMGPEWVRDGTMPNSEGFWWGKWRIKAEGTSDPDDTPGNEWEVMHVVENTLDVDDDEHLMVMVPGVEKWQPLENFVWGPKALPAAPKES